MEQLAREVEIESSSHSDQIEAREQMEAENKLINKVTGDVRGALSAPSNLPTCILRQLRERERER